MALLQDIRDQGIERRGALQCKLTRAAGRAHAREGHRCNGRCPSQPRKIRALRTNIARILTIQKEEEK